MLQFLSARNILLALALIVFPSVAVLRAADLETGDDSLLNLVEELKGALSINAPVRVIIVDDDSRLVSVRPVAEVAGSYELRLERAFLDELDPEEVEAVLAHELGHVWIYTHHPYLQTEDLANSIAGRVVARETLDRVYTKVRKYRAGTLATPDVTPTAVAETVPAGRR